MHLDRPTFSSRKPDDPNEEEEMCSTSLDGASERGKNEGIEDSDVEGEDDTESGDEAESAEEASDEARGS